MKELTFEQAMAKLEKIVHQLENGEVTLEESMELFEQGVALAKTCNQKLSAAEAKVEILLEKNGDLIKEAFDPEQQGEESG